MCRLIYILRLSFATRLGGRYKSKSGLGAAGGAPPPFPARPSCPAVRIGGHPGLKLCYEEQMLDPMSHMSCRVSPTLPRTRGQVRGKGQEVIWAQAETTPPPRVKGGHPGPGRDLPPSVKGVVFSFPSFDRRAPPNRTSAQHPVRH